MEENQETNVEEKKEDSEEKKESSFKNVNKWHISTAVLGVLFIVSLFTGGFGLKDTTGSAAVNGELNVIVLNDERCIECDATGLIAQLKVLFPGVNVEEVDYSDKKGKELYEENSLQYLPAVLFSENIKEEIGYSDIASYMEVKGEFLSLKVGANFDPESEICDNGKDDDNDDLVDCGDDDCSSEWMCMEKKEVPEVEAFVFSYCPYGLQFQKALLPVYKLFKNIADIDLVAIGAMHGEYEKQESLRQICIQENYGKDKLWDYLEAFMGDTNVGDCNNDMGCSRPLVEAIMGKLGIDKTKINSCMKTTGVSIYNDQNARAKALGISGSPTFVVNDAKAQVGRNAEAIKEAICIGFKNEPSECSQILSTDAVTPWFGYENSVTSANSVEGSC